MVVPGSFQAFLHLKGTLSLTQTCCRLGPNQSVIMEQEQSSKDVTHMLCSVSRVSNIRPGGQNQPEPVQSLENVKESIDL